MLPPRWSNINSCWSVAERSDSLAARWLTHTCWERSESQWNLQFKVKGGEKQGGMQSSGLSDQAFVPLRPPAKPAYHLVHKKSTLHLHSLPLLLFYKYIYIYIYSLCVSLSLSPLVYFVEAVFNGIIQHLFNGMKTHTSFIFQPKSHIAK